MWSNKPFRAARLSLVATSSLLVGSVMSLLLNWARLGTEGESWGLLQNCPICVVAARLIGPIAAVDTASRVAANMVLIALVLSLLGFAYFAVVRMTSAFQTFIIAVGGLILALAPIVFVMLLPESVPIHLNVGGYTALFFGILTMLATTAGQQAEYEYEDEERIAFHSNDLEKEDILPPQETSPRSQASVAASYGAIGLARPPLSRNNTDA